MRGYWISGFNSTLPAEKGYRNKLHQFAKEWEDAQSSENPRQAIRTIINTVHTETDSDTETLEEGVSWEALYARREPYVTPETRGSALLPEPVRVIDASIDVQGNRLEILFMGWARDEQAWILDLEIIYGPPSDVLTWDAAERAIQRRFEHPSGVTLTPSLVFVDRGKWTEDVDRFAARKSIRSIVWTCKGASEMGLPIIGRIRKAGGGATYFRLGTDAAKDYIFGRLALPTPAPGEPAPPGFIHFPLTLDVEAFKQITSERPKLVYERGKQFRKYVLCDESGNEVKKTGRKIRNEMLDLMVYALAAFRLRRWEWDELDASISEAEKLKKGGKPKPAPPPVEDEDEEGGFVDGWRRR